jgi:hypothetical protein
MALNIIMELFKEAKIVEADKQHQHYVALLGQNKAYIIYTTRTLRNSRTVFGHDYGEMLGVRHSILLGDYDYIVWVVNRGNCYEVYMERSHKINSFCLDNRTIYRNSMTGEYICNYPVSMARKVAEKCINKTLLSYLK